MRAPVLTLGALVLAAMGCALGCARPSSLTGPYGTLREAPGAGLTMPEVTQREWTHARERLAVLRRAQPTEPYVERVRLAIEDPATGKRYKARGAVAVSPGYAARMLLVGPGGATALDVWVTEDHFRFAVPSLDYERRGGDDPAEAAGLPVGLLRWWFLSPLEGRLLVARSSARESAWLLRDGDATVTLRSDGASFFAVRREGETLEGMQWRGAPGLVPKAGARGRYVEGRTGLRVDVFIEDVLDAAPDPAAFADPDAREETSL